MEEEPGILGEDGVVAPRGLVGGEQLRPVELLGQLDVHELVALEQALDVLVPFDDRERDGHAVHGVLVRGVDERAEGLDRHERDETASWMSTELTSPRASSPLYTDSWRDAPPRMHSNLDPSRWLASSSRVGSRWASGRL